MTRRAATVLAVASMLLAASCAGDRADGDGVELTAEVDRAAATAAAVDVRTEGCGPRLGFGSGSVIATADGTPLVLTAAHVVAGGTGYEVIDVDGDTTTAVPVLFDPDLDVAVLALTDPVGAPIPLRRTEGDDDELGVVVLPRLADGVVTVRTVEVRVVRPVSISTTDILGERDVERPGLELQAAIEPGDSGSVVVLAGGGVGVVWARSSETDGRAWASDIPPAVRDLADDPSGRQPVDVGRCVGR